MLSLYNLKFGLSQTFRSKVQTTRLELHAYTGVTQIMTELTLRDPSLISSLVRGAGAADELREVIIRPVVYEKRKRA